MLSGVVFLSWSIAKVKARKPDAVNSAKRPVST